VFVDMNRRLFDALPGMLIEENGRSSLMIEEASGVAFLKGAMSWVYKQFADHSADMTKLGHFMTDMTSKWAVCPLQPLNTTGSRDLDLALDKEDDFYKDYMKQAYSEWTGEKNGVPGEVCQPTDLFGSPSDGCQVCDLSVMEANAPEAYLNESFICPIRPMLPATMQLEVLKKKEGLCPLHMDHRTQVRDHWQYRGIFPTIKQFDRAENHPQKFFQTVHALERHASVDEFGVPWDFYKFARGCTVEERRVWPRWCESPEVRNKQTISKKLWEALRTSKDVSVGGAQTVTDALQLTNVSVNNPNEVDRWETFKEWSGHQLHKSWYNMNKLFSFRRKRRHGREYNSTFGSREAHGLMWASSFQKYQGLERSKGEDTIAQTTVNAEDRYQRYAVVCPCAAGDPEEDFNIRFQWSEAALQLLRKAFQKTDIAILGPAVKLDIGLRGVASLYSEKGGHGTHWRTHAQWNAHYTLLGGHAGKLPWTFSKSQSLRVMSGAEEEFGLAYLEVDDLFGYTGAFRCGKKMKLYTKDAEATPVDHAEPFQSCVMRGALANEENRKKLAAAGTPHALFEDQYVVHVVFTPLGPCECHGKESIVGGSEFSLAHRTLKDACNACSNTTEGVLGDLTKDPEYDGTFVGAGAGANQAKEVLIEPSDVASLLGWK